MKPRHTEIVETVQTPIGLLVREDYYRYPASESNLYMLGADGTVMWFAERASSDDAYANSIRMTNNGTIKCASWNCFDCEIDLQTGELLNAQFTK